MNTESNSNPTRTMSPAEAMCKELIEDWSVPAIELAEAILKRRFVIISGCTEEREYGILLSCEYTDKELEPPFTKGRYWP